MDDTGGDRYEALVRVRPSQKGESEEENRTGKKTKKKQYNALNTTVCIILEIKVN